VEKSFCGIAFNCPVQEPLWIAGISLKTMAFHIPTRVSETENGLLEPNRVGWNGDLVFGVITR